MEQKLDKEILELADTSPNFRPTFNKVFADIVKHYDKPLLGSEIIKLYYPIIDATEAHLLSKYLKIYLDGDLIIDLAYQIYDLHMRSYSRKDIYFDRSEPITVQKISDYFDFPILLAREIFERVIDVEDEKYGK